MDLTSSPETSFADDIFVTFRLRGHHRGRERWQNSMKAHREGNKKIYKNYVNILW